MKREDLQRLKEKLALLSAKEKLEHDLYLRKIVTGEVEGPMTGYPSLDKPWLACYDEEKYKIPNVNQNITRALFLNNVHNKDLTALEYFGSKITYKKFFDEIMKLVKTLDRNGIGKGDYVSVCSAGIPEAMYSVYALGYLGAVGLFLPPYLNKETMKKDILKNNSRILIVMDKFYNDYKDVFDEVISETSIEKVVVVPTLNSSILGKLKRKEKYSDPKFTTYNEFTKDGNLKIVPNMADYEKQMPLAVVYSSGTTGDLKGVLLSHDSVNNSAQSYRSFGFDLEKGQRFYQAIPVWSSTGLIADGTSTLYYGSTLFQNPLFDPLVYSKNLGLHRLNWGIGTTELFSGLESIYNSKKYQRLMKLGLMDYSGLNNVYIGGTPTTFKDKEKLNQLLQSLGSKAKVNSSYGNCENGSIVTAELNHMMTHPKGSVGIPIPGVDIMIIDEDCNELPYGKRGEIAINTNCGMISYYNRDDLNEKIFFKDESGITEYKHTGDMGTITPDGNLIYLGRMNDYSVIEDKKVFHFDLKNVLLEDDDVFDCEVFSRDGVLYVDIVFYDQNIYGDDKIIKLQEDLCAAFGDLTYVPEFFKARASFPMASSTKRDYKKIKEEITGYNYISKSHLKGYSRIRKI